MTAALSQWRPQLRWLGERSASALDGCRIQLARPLVSVCGSAGRLCDAHNGGCSARAAVAEHQRQMRGFRAMQVAGSGGTVPVAAAKEVSRMEDLTQLF
jgi:hypothetical protein